MNKKVALVTDLKVVDSPQAGLGVARCLKNSGFKVIGVDDTPLVTQSEDLFDKVLCWEEFRTLNFDSLIKKLIDVKETYGLDYIFPCYDETAILFSFIKDKLDFLGIKLIAPSKDMLKKLRKENLAELIGDDAKYCTPKRKVIKSVEEAKKIAELFGFPVICKGLTKSAYICKNENDLAQNIQRISDIWNGGEIACIIEEYIIGRYVNCIVAIKDNKVIGYVEMQKIGLDQNGATWFGKIKKTKELLPLAEELVKKNNFSTCIIEIETIEKDGKYFVYEINPRTPAWVYAPSLLGLNLPELIIKDKNNNKTDFVKEEGFFGREAKDFIRKDIQGYEDKMTFYSKGAAYKGNGYKYPSELLLDL
jgi:carbamoyl-phosphate synthase large subunit